MGEGAGVPGHVVAPPGGLHPMHAPGVDPHHLPRPLHEPVARDLGLLKKKSIQYLLSTICRYIKNSMVDPDIFGCPAIEENCGKANKSLENQIIVNKKL